MPLREKATLTSLGGVKASASAVKTATGISVQAVYLNVQSVGAIVVGSASASVSS